MPWQNFIPAVEAKKLLKERDKYLILAAHCTREYEGEVRRAGDRVKIFGVGSPTIYTLEKDGKYTANQVGAGSIAGTGKQIVQGGIPTAEDIEDTEVEFAINQMALWNWGMGDVDAALMGGAKGKMAHLRQKQGKRLAEIHDKYIAKVMAGFTPCKYKEAGGNRNGVYYIKNGAEVTTSGSQSINPCDLIDNIVQKLNEQDIPDSEQLVLECSPRFWKILKKEYRDLDTNNSAMLAGRKCGEYNDIKVFKTNNTTVDGKEYIFVRTLDSVAFCDPHTQTKAYEPERGFAEAVKGWNLYDAAIVDPKGLISVEVNYA